jgi:hypothetical protein
MKEVSYESTNATCPLCGASARMSVWAKSFAPEEIQFDTGGLAWGQLRFRVYCTDHDCCLGQDLGRFIYAKTEDNVLAAVYEFVKTRAEKWLKLETEQ